MSVLAAVGVAILFLALFALEISDGIMLHDGELAKSMWFFPPVLALFWGMLTRRRWALFAAWWLAFLATLWFAFIGVFACVAQPVDAQGRVWIWIACVSAVLGTLVGIGFVGLGRPSARRHYGLTCPRCPGGATGLRACFTRQVRCTGCGHCW
jgi:hypothetical protein